MYWKSEMIIQCQTIHFIKFFHLFKETNFMVCDKKVSSLIWIQPVHNLDDYYNYYLFKKLYFGWKFCELFFIVCFYVLRLNFLRLFLWFESI